jgi:hypothetical protein
VIHQQLEEFRSPEGNVISLEEWRRMADHMGGIAAMGGAPVGLLRQPDAQPPVSDTTATDPGANAPHDH